MGATRTARRCLSARIATASRRGDDCVHDTASSTATAAAAVAGHQRPGDAVADTGVTCFFAIRSEKSTEKIKIAKRSCLIGCYGVGSGGNGDDANGSPLLLSTDVSGGRGTAPRGGVAPAAVVAAVAVAALAMPLGGRSADDRAAAVGTGVATVAVAAGRAAVGRTAGTCNTCL